jgi:HEXXH motif-containing protein
LFVPFRPDGTRGALVDDAVRRNTAESLSLLSDAIGAQRPDLIASLQRWIANLHSGAVRPALFALYSDLVEAIFSDDEPAFQSAMIAISEIEAEASDGIRGITLADGDLGPGMALRFRRHLDDDPTTPLSIGSISREELRIASDCLTATWNLLDVAAPELSREIRALVRDVIFVASEPGTGGLVFHGASTFYLWGGLFLNARMHPDRVSMAEGLAHEAAHSLLLGYSFGGPLVDNNASERFASPLREDPRPMDGIVHATYVLARMHYCIERLLASQVLNAAERDRLEAAKLRRRSDYLQGLEVVSIHARFTPVGRALFEGAQTYMAAAGTG